MSSLCTLPTHKGAFFLKDFLLDYFGIRIVAKETAGGESKEIYLPPQQTLMVWVYVLHASPSIVGSRCLGDRRHTNNNSSQPTHSGSFTSHLLQLPYFQCLWRQLQRFRVEFDVQPSDMAAGVLRKHIQTRPNGMKYVSFGLLEYIGQYCPMVVQFEFGGGVLQVYGPSVVKDVPSTGPSKKRYRSQPEGSATRLKRVRGETTTPSSSSVEHGIKVSNAILFEGSRQNLAGPLFSPTAVAREIEYAMDALYYTLHPRSFRKLYQTHKNRMLCHRKKRQRGEAIPDEVTLPTAEEVRITDEMLRHIFPFTVRGEGRLTEHLRGTIKSLLHQVCHLNVRGIFLKLFHKRKNLYQSPTSLLDGLISLDEVELYLRECFSKLHSEQDKSISFWGVDTDSANENIASISRNFRGWMQNNKPFLLRDFLDKVKVGKIPFVAGLFPPFGDAKHRNRRSLLLQRIVAQLSFFLSQYVVPFLLKKQFYFSRLNTKSNQYSFNIQEELCFLRDRHYGRLRRDSYPFRTILHNNNILITPLSVWNKAVRQEMKSYRREGRLAPLDSSSCAPTDDGLLLYASVRFLLTLQLDEAGEDCAVRLRPIAVLREGTRQALLNKSKGLLSYSSRLYHFLSRCTGVGPADSGNKRPFTSGRLAAQEKLKVVLDVLKCNFFAHLRREGLPGSLLGGDNALLDEYANVSSFTESLRENSPNTDLQLYALKTDASRFYDRIHQTFLWDALEKYLFPHTGDGETTYANYFFTVLKPLAGRRYGTSISEIVLGKEDVERGVLYGIPSKVILVENSGSNRYTIPQSQILLTLKAHLVNHPAVFLHKFCCAQRTGIIQGSTVAPLLCNFLLRTFLEPKVLDALGYFHSSHLLLRRMDDVLLLSTSPFAVRYIHQRLFEAKEFERIGYFANAKKMVRIAERREDGQIPWCGMVLHVSGGVSLDWSRLRSSFQQLSLLQQDLCGGGLGAPRRAGSAEELLGALLAVAAFVVKNVLTSRFSNPFLLSPSLNSVNRILQNYFELGVCWSRCIALKMLWYFRVNVLSAHFSAGPLVRAFARRVFLSVKKVVARLKADVNTHPFDFATIESCVVFSFWNEVTSLLGGCFSDAPSAMEMGEMKPLYDAARARLDSFFPLGR